MYNEILTAGAITAIIFASLILYTAYRVGGIRAALSYLKGNSAMMGIKMVVFAMMLAGIVLTAIFYGTRANALELSYFERTTLFAGVDAEIGSTIFCERDGINSTLVSNAGARQHLITINGIELLANYTHHSCALNRDKPTYDALGLSVEWTFKRGKK